MILVDDVTWMSAEVWTDFIGRIKQLQLAKTCNTPRLIVAGGEHGPLPGSVLRCEMDRVITLPKNFVHSPGFQQLLDRMSRRACTHEDVQHLVARLSWNIEDDHDDDGTEETDKGATTTPATSSMSCSDSASGSSKRKRSDDDDEEAEHEQKRQKTSASVVKTYRVGVYCDVKTVEEENDCRTMQLASLSSPTVGGSV